MLLRFEAILGFTRNEQMRSLLVFRGNTNGAENPRNITSHVYNTRNILGENMTKPGEVK